MGQSETRTVEKHYGDAMFGSATTEFENRGETRGKIGKAGRRFGQVRLVKILKRVFLCVTRNQYGQAIFSARKERWNAKASCIPIAGESAKSCLAAPCFISHGLVTFSDQAQRVQRFLPQAFGESFKSRRLVRTPDFFQQHRLADEQLGNPCVVETVKRAVFEKSLEQ